MAETLLIVLCAVVLLLILLIWYQSRRLSKALSRTQSDLSMHMAMAVNALDMANLHLVGMLREQLQPRPLLAEPLKVSPEDGAAGMLLEVDCIVIVLGGELLADPPAGPASPTYAMPPEAAEETPAADEETEPSPSCNLD